MLIQTILEATVQGFNFRSELFLDMGHVTTILMTYCWILTGIIISMSFLFTVWSDFSFGVYADDPDINPESSVTLYHPHVFFRFFRNFFSWKTPYFLFWIFTQDPEYITQQY